MSSAFTLTMAYLAEHANGDGAAGALAAYVTGNVASNLLGRLASAALTDHFGLAANFLVLAALNLAGAALVFVTLEKAAAMRKPASVGSTSDNGMGEATAWLGHPRQSAARCNLRHRLPDPVRLHRYLHLREFRAGPRTVVPRPDASRLRLFGVLAGAAHHALRRTCGERNWSGPRHPPRIRAAIIGLPLLLAPSLPTVLVGLALIGAGTFAAQAIATGFVGRLATSDRGAASGLYLAAYYLSGLAGSAILGRIFDTAGWVACVAAITLSLLAALTLTLRLGRVFEPSRSFAQTNPS